MHSAGSPLATASQRGQQFIDDLRSQHPRLGWTSLSDDVTRRIGNLVIASPLYERLIQRFPEYLIWLERPRNWNENFRFQALLDEWRDFSLAAETTDRSAPAYLNVLRRFRRKMTLRIAYRDINSASPTENTIQELTRLAEFVLCECYFVAKNQWDDRYGVPWDDALDRPARFCALGLGKLGGQELNFSSDIDLIYLYEGEGQCRRNDHPGSFSNPEYFAKLCETMTRYLNEKNEEGFLFRADLRLRPGGSSAPICPSFTAVENYYAAAGQTWERLALLKARPVAGDLGLGAELLENLHSFRYPRHPPASLLTEIAAMKVRTEREVVGTESLDRDVKSGTGGIREIEFFVQTLQLLHAGRFPFLQTHSTVGALHQLNRYDLLDGEEATFLESAYGFLRDVEHRIQMREEQQTHKLPADSHQLESLAASLGFDNLAAFNETLSDVRERVHGLYVRLFKDAVPSQEFDAWWTYFADEKIEPEIANRLQHWFGSDTKPERHLQLFVRGGMNRPLTRDQVHRFVSLASIFDSVVPQLAAPLATLQRISDFAESYGSRTEFLTVCIMSPDFFRVMAYLFDRSTFTFDILRRHPEILEEVLRPEILRKQKDRAVLRREISQASGQPGFSEWLWLFVRAEQIRAAIGHLLGFFSVEQVEAHLSDLADAVLSELLLQIDPKQRLLLVALGKYGGRELTFGSDLDIILVRQSGETDQVDPIVRQLKKILGPNGERNSLFEIDFRLRPHGSAGPLVPTLAAFRDYHKGPAQSWEKQILTRARVVHGTEDLTNHWESFRQQLLFSSPLDDESAAALWKMRLRIQHERDAVHPPERAFKTGAGGLVDFEFLAQLLQLRFGCQSPALRTPGTRESLHELARTGILPKDEYALIIENYNFLKSIEIHLRRAENKAVSVIPKAAEKQHALAVWMGFTSRQAFWADYTEKLKASREVVERRLTQTFHDLLS